MTLPARVRGMITRALVQSVVDSGDLQLAVVSRLYGQPADDAERVQQFGLSSNPPSGSTGVVLAAGGAQSNLVVIAVEHKASRQRGLQPGETALYNQWGDRAVLRKDGTFRIDSRLAVEINAPLTHVLHDLQVDGKSYLVGDVHAGGNLSVDGAGTFLGALRSLTSVMAPLVQQALTSIGTIVSTFNAHGHGGGPGPSPTL